MTENQHTSTDHELQRVPFPLKMDKKIKNYPSFSARDVLINGHSGNLASYIKKHDLDTRLPLAADYYGAQVNISFQTVDEETGEVKFSRPYSKVLNINMPGP